MSTDITDSVVGLFMGFCSNFFMTFGCCWLSTPSFFHTYLFHIFLWDNLIDEKFEKSNNYIFGVKIRTLEFFLETKMDFSDIFSLVFLPS